MQSVKQWELKHHDDFENEKSLDGWSDKRTSHCLQNINNKHLGGHCNFSFNEVSKTYENLTNHKELRVNALFHMLDEWNGESAYMKINGKIVWSRIGRHNKKKGLNICGGEANDPDFNM